MSAPNFGGLAHILVSNGLVAPDAMTKALTEAQQQSMAIVPYLVENKVAPANKIASLLAHEFGDPLFDLNALSPDAVNKELVDEKIINQYGALPLFKRGNKLLWVCPTPPV